MRAAGVPKSMDVVQRRVRQTKDLPQGRLGVKISSKEVCGEEGQCQAGASVRSRFLSCGLQKP
eukprot:scaffold13038_cov41-Attheya_sp.AAC.1